MTTLRRQILDLFALAEFARINARRVAMFQRRELVRMRAEVRAARFWS